MSNEPTKSQRISLMTDIAALRGLAAVGVAVTGIAGLICAVCATGSPAGFTGAGACLLASAVAFGLLANAIYRE